MSDNNEVKASLYQMLETPHGIVSQIILLFMLEIFITRNAR